MGPCLHGLPQGPQVLGPLLHIIYTSELSSLLTAHDVLGQLYAVQAYLHCLASNAIAAVRAMTLASGALVAWWPECRQIVCGSIHTPAAR